MYLAALHEFELPKADIDWTSAQSHCRKSEWQGKTVAR